MEDSYVHEFFCELSGHPVKLVAEYAEEEQDIVLRSVCLDGNPLSDTIVELLADDIIADIVNQVAAVEEQVTSLLVEATGTQTIH